MVLEVVVSECVQVQEDNDIGFYCIISMLVFVFYICWIMNSIFTKYFITVLCKVVSWQFSILQWIYYVSFILYTTTLCWFWLSLLRAFTNGKTSVLKVGYFVI